MKRIAVVVVALAVLASACSSGSPIVPGAFRGPVAVVPFRGYNPENPGPDSPIVDLIAIASVRGSELKLLDPIDDTPVQGPNLAWALAIPTLPRPTFLASSSLGDGAGLADLLVVAGAEPVVQIVGTWVKDPGVYGVAETLDLSAYTQPGDQVLSMAIALVPDTVPATPPSGVPAVSPVRAGRAWVVLGLTDVLDPRAGKLLVLELARQGDGSIALAAEPRTKPLTFAPVGLAAAPDNVHIYAATQDPIRDPAGAEVLGLAEVDVSQGLAGPWPVRGFDARGAGTFTVAAAFVGERTQENFYTFAPPALRVYASLDPSGCGPERDIACGVATFDPALGGLATDPAPAGPPGWKVPIQGYRAPIPVAALPIAMGIAPPAANPGPNAPSTPFGSQVCFSPAVAGQPLPLCPSVTEVASNPPFNPFGAPQKFMLTAPPTGQLWTSVVALVTAIDGLAYVQDLGRFGPVNAVSMLNDDTTRTNATGAAAIGPLGPLGNSSLFGFPSNTAAIGFWLQETPSSTPVVVNDAADLEDAITVWPGFTKDDFWLVSYQGVLPGLTQRRAVLGLAAGGELYLAVQDAAVPSIDGELPADSYWVPGVIVDRPELGLHTLDMGQGPGDVAQFLLDNDPCASTRPNWIPTGGTVPVYDPTKAPQAHEAVLQSLLPENSALYPGGAMLLAPAPDSTLAAEYQCLVEWLQRPENAGQVLTAFRNNPPSTDYVRGAWVRAGGLLLVGQITGYAGRPVMDVQYDLAWTDEAGLTGEALVLARKARRFYYPSAYPNRAYQGFPDMDDPMMPGPALGFRVGRFCPSFVADCNATTSPPARDAGVSFFTRSGLVAMSRYPSSTAGGNFVSSFDKSVLPGLEYLGRVFYTTFTGDLVMITPPGLDVAQNLSIR